MDLITVFLPSNFRGVEILSPYQLNLVKNGDLVDVYFWKPSIEANGKHFCRIAKKDVKSFKAACAGEEV
tara:strand:+ start:131 stop:337 length:207 start_codon:yes stop_codon:yes gene_type:complete